MEKTYVNLFSKSIYFFAIFIMVFNTLSCSFVKQPSDQYSVVEKVEKTINYSKSASIKTENITIDFPAGSLSKTSQVSISELGENSDIAIGILVNIADGRIEEAVSIEFNLEHNLSPGTIVPLLQSDGMNKTWEAATSAEGKPNVGVVSMDGTILAFVDHFSAYGLPKDIFEMTNQLTERLIWDTNRYKVDENLPIYTPVDFSESAIIYGYDKTDVFRLLGGLAEEDKRIKRYEDVLVDLFVQSDIEFSDDTILEIEKYLAEQLGPKIEITLGGGAEVVKLGRDYKTVLRVVRPGFLGWSKHARLDFVAKRLAESVTFLENTASFIRVTDDFIIISRDIYRALLYNSLRDAVVMERMDRFESLLNQKAYVDPALTKGFKLAKDKVERELNNAVSAWFEILAENFDQYLSIGADGLILAKHGFTGLAKASPWLLTLEFVKFYNDEILDSFADLQRASLAATLYLVIFPSTDTLEDGVKNGDSESTDLAVMKLYLGQYYYSKIAERFSGSWLNKPVAWFWDFWDGKDHSIWIERERYLKIIAEDMFEEYKVIEEQRQFIYGGDGTSNSQEIPSNDELDAKIDEIIDLINAREMGKTYTVIVLDVSGSMNQSDPSGRSKMEAAKLAAQEMVSQLEIANNSMGTDHQVAIIAFDDRAYVKSDFTSDFVLIKSTLRDLSPNGGTDISDGLSSANKLLARTQGLGKNFIILMTDGDSGEDIDDFIQGPLAIANSQRSCVYTVAFGNDADRDLLRQIAKNSFCGNYYEALDAFELAATYSSAAATTVGSNVTNLTGIIKEGQQIFAGNYTVPPGQAVLTTTLMWEGSTLTTEIYNPAGKLVKIDGYRVQISNLTPTSESIMILAPEEGEWEFRVIGIDVPQSNGERYHLTASSISMARLRGEEVDIVPSSSNTNSELPANYTCPDLSDVRLRVGYRAAIVFDKVNLRTYAQVPDDHDSNVVAELERNTKITVIGGPECSHNGTWWEIQTDSGYTGWMRELTSGQRLLDTLLNASSLPSSPSSPQIPLCPGSLPTRIQVGMTIQVTTSGNVPKLGIRPKPTLDIQKQFELISGEKMSVLDGPVCANESYFWYINSAKGKGWVREGNTEFYFVDPLP
jgi:Mg-chelatase subunit ChlD